jgi:multidrug efflux system membrane fusion protein
MGHLKTTALPDTYADPARSGRTPEAKSRWWLWLIVLAIVVGAGVWYFKSKGSTEAQGPAGAPQGAKGGRPGQGMPVQAVPVVVATAQRGDLPVYFNGLGTVTAFNTVTVRSRVDGQIVKINFTEGQTVHQGDALVEIDPRPYQVQLEQTEGQLAKDQAQLRDVQVDYERFQLLFKEGVIPKQQVDTQQALVGQNLGAIKADQGAIDNAKLQIVYSHITAPITGRVGLRLVDMGNIVHAADTTGLLVITQLQPIAVIFALPQDQLSQVLSKLHGSQPLQVDAYDRDDVTRIATGKLLTIDNQIDTTTGTYKLKSEFSNDKNLLFPNQFVNVHLLVDTKHSVTIVPSTAIQRGPQGTYVYLAQRDNTVKIQPVTVALASGSSVGVSTGLQAGDNVVVDGQDKLQDGSKIEARTSTGGSTAPGGSQAQNQDQTPPSNQPSQQGQSSQQPAPPSGRKGKRQ